MGILLYFARGFLMFLLDKEEGHWKSEQVKNAYMLAIQGPFKMPEK